jgi:hypothetical protein
MQDARLVLHRRAVLALGEELRAAHGVGAPRVAADQPFPDEILTRLAQWQRHVVRRVEVQLIQVDVVGPEPIERRPDRLVHILRRVVLVVHDRGRLVEGVTPLGRDDHLVPLPLERLAQHPFAVPGAVRIGRVEERHAELDGPADRPDRLVVVDLAPPQRLTGRIRERPADGPAPESDRADLDPHSSQSTFLHASTQPAATSSVQ